jgi:hypothetical protein
MATCLLCRNNFTDPAIVNEINSNPHGWCPSCVNNAENGVEHQQPNVGVAPLVEPLKAFEQNAQASTGYEATSYAGNQNQVASPNLPDEGDRPLAQTGQQGNEAYNQGLPPKTGPEAASTAPVPALGQAPGTPGGANEPNVNEPGAPPVTPG